ncbi:peptidase inhibitor family I36 protein, partial [Streptomyces avermitilis]
MMWKRIFATSAATLTLLGGSMLATAAPAQADGTCPSNALCIWDSTSFGGLRILTRSTNTCFNMGKFDFGYIRSYDNNLSVNGYVHNYAGSGVWYQARTLPAGGFSSDIGVPGLGGLAEDWVCMGSADLSDFV